MLSRRSRVCGHIQFDQLRKQLGADVAVTTLGVAYGPKVIVDDSLASEPEIYFEGGDHASRVYVSGEHFGTFWQAPDMGGSPDLINRGERLSEPRR